MSPANKPDTEARVKALYYIMQSAEVRHLLTPRGRALSVKLLRSLQAVRQCRLEARLL